MKACESARTEQAATGRPAGSDAAGFEVGGEPVCLMHRLCPACGHPAHQDPPTRCPNCGTFIDEQ